MTPGLSVPLLGRHGVDCDRGPVGVRGDVRGLRRILMSGFNVKSAHDIRAAFGLMDAAPDMLAALQAIADFEPDPGSEFGHYKQIAIFARMTARSAIARATGKPTTLD